VVGNLGMDEECCPIVVAGMLIKVEKGHEGKSYFKNSEAPYACG